MNPLAFLRRPAPEPEVYDDEPAEPRLRFIPPALDDELAEWERPKVGAVTFRPLLWTAGPPEPRDRWWYVRYRGTSEYTAFFVQHDDEIWPSGFEWCGPLPVPPR